jgi:hypothetical protein
VALLFGLQVFECFGYIKYIILNFLFYVVPLDPIRSTLPLRASDCQWRLAFKSKSRNLAMAGDPTIALTGCCWSYDSRFLFTCSTDGHVVSWRVPVLNSLLNSVDSSPLSSSNYQNNVIGKLGGLYLDVELIYDIQIGNDGITYSSHILHHFYLFIYFFLFPFLHKQIHNSPP